MAEMAEIACVLDTNCTVEMDAEISNYDYLYRRYKESWIGALIAVVLLSGLFACKIKIFKWIKFPFFT